MSRFTSFLLKFTKVFILITLPFVLMFVGALVTMLIAIRGTDVTVPNVVGADKTRALQALEKAKLRGDVVESRFSHDIPMGHVMGQAPSAGSAAKADSRVRLTLSEGKRRVAVPLVTGFSLAQAQGMLQQAGLKAGYVTYIHLSETPREEVLDQNPPPGNQSPDSLSVNLLVNIPEEVRPTFIMPDLTGLDADTVRSFLERQRFTVNPVESGASLFAASSGRVVSQAPAPGAAFTRNTVITLRAE